MNPVNPNMLNDKINREFLRLHIGETITISGTYVSHGHHNSMLMMSCKYYDDLIDSNIIIPHMWLQNILNENEFKLRKGDIIFVTGTVNSYQNFDSTYSLETTMELRNCRIQSAVQNIFFNRQ